MRKTWRKEKGCIIATAIEADAAISDSSAISTQEHAPRLLAFLRQNMAAAIVTALLADEDADSLSEGVEGEIE